MEREFFDALNYPHPDLERARAILQEFSPYNRERLRFFTDLEEWIREQRALYPGKTDLEIHLEEARRTTEEILLRRRARQPS